MPGKNKKRLTAYIAVWIVGILLFFVGVNKIIFEIRCLNSETERQSRISSFLDVVDRKIEDNKNALKILSRNNIVRGVLLKDISFDVNQANTVLEAAKDILSASLVYVMNFSGEVVASSSYDDDKTLIGNNYSFRPYFIEAMNERESFYPAIGVTTLKRGLYFGLPVYDSADKVIGVIVLKMGLDEIDEYLKKYPFPNALISVDSVIFSSNRDDWVLKSLTALSQENQNHLKETKQYAEISIVPLGLEIIKNDLVVDGKKQHFFIKKMTIPGWKALFCYQAETIGKLSNFQKLVVKLVCSLFIIVFTICLVIAYNSKRYSLPGEGYLLLWRILFVVFGLILVALILGLVGFYYFERWESHKRIAFSESGYDFFVKGRVSRNL
ncbi:MAG: hypothetical protein PHV17_00985 [Candidatus Omnitrophica bacterium]|nr:hypothetical protein [Candidatus Omnitrophota bacterium]